MCITPVYWSRLRRTRYGSNGYSPIHITSLLSLKMINLWINIVFVNKNTPFQELSAIFEMKMSVHRMQLQFTQSGLKSKSLSRTCSVNTNLGTSANISFQNDVRLSCAVSANYATVPYSIISFISGALLKAVLQANTDSFPNAMVKMRNQIAETWNGLRTRKVPV